MDNEDPSSQLTDTESQLSQHSPARGPYLDEELDITFGQHYYINTPAGAGQSFVRSLLQSGNGYPLWNLNGNMNRQKEHLRNSFGIGDVGVVDSEASSFDFYFNIFRAPDDPIHKGNLPEGFQPFKSSLDPRSVNQSIDHFPQGSIITSKGVSIERTSKTDLNMTFTTSAREAAILVLPDGASREDLVYSEELMEYLKLHTLSWYRFLNLGQTHINPNASIYVITGCDRAKSYAMACIPYNPEFSGQKTVVRYEDSKSEPWHSVPCAHERSDGPNSDIDRYTFFIRGIRLAVNPRVWMSDVLEYEPPSVFPSYNILVTPILGLRSRFAYWKEQRRGVAREDSTGSSKPTPFHPSLILAPIMFKEYPNAEVAIVEDYTWCSACNADDGTYPQLVQLLTRVLTSHDIVSRNGIIRLVPVVADQPPQKNTRPNQHVLSRLRHLVDQLFNSRRKSALRKVVAIIPPR